MCMCTCVAWLHMHLMTARTHAACSMLLFRIYTSTLLTLLKCMVYSRYVAWLMAFTLTEYRRNAALLLGHHWSDHVDLVTLQFVYNLLRLDKTACARLCEGVRKVVEGLTFLRGQDTHQMQLAGVRFGVASLLQVNAASAEYLCGWC